LIIEDIERFGTRLRWLNRAERMRSAAAITFLIVSLWAIGGRAQEEAEQRDSASSEERNFVLEIGPAAEWPLHGERANYGGNVAVEKDVIENWLELEAGLTGLGTSGRGELSADLLFKKPFRLSPELEFFIGVGPEIAHAFSSSEGTTASVEFASELMFMPRSGLGWYVEPAFSVAPATGKKAFGLTAGLAIAF
jgi:hypothetical protein